MSPYPYLAALWWCLWLVWSAPVLAETVELEPKATRLEASALSESDLQHARQWGLDEAEWRRYRILMAGPRGLWSPDLDPLLVLGIHARTEAERRRYAELAVRQERARVEAELAFQRAYTEAWQRLYPDEPLFDIDTQQLSPTAGPAWQPGDRVLFFTRTDCAACEALLAPLLSRVRALAGVGLDIYLLGMETDAAVRAWAQTKAIPPDLVRNRKVTLNHDHGALARLSYGAGDPPYLMLKRLDNRFEFLPTAALGFQP